MTAPEPAPATPPTERGRSLWLCAAVAAFLVVALLLCREAAGRPPILFGDGLEYFYQVEAIHAHGSPDLRPDDVARTRAATERVGFGPDPQGNPPYAFFPGRSGKLYSIHFIAYAASSVPARWALELTGGEPLACLQVANVGWGMFGVGAVLFFGSGSLARRLVLAGLTAAGPAFGYWRFTGAELYSYGLVTAALVAVGRRCYPAAALLASLGALQNSPIALLAGVSVLMALARRWWRSSLLAVAGAAVSLVPFAYYKRVFDVWNPFAGLGDPDHISWMRTWSQLADLSQGLLPYVPFLVILAPVAVVLLALRRSLDGLLVAAALAGMSAATQTHINWNSACIGAQRYLVWMIPILAWLAVEALWPRLWGRVLLVAAVVAHAALLDLNPGRFDGVHSPVARWVLNNHPEWYDIEPELFVERTLCQDGVLVRAGVPSYPRQPVHPPHPPVPLLPFGYFAPGNIATKILVDAESVKRLPERFEVTPEYMEEVRARVAGRSRPIYIHPRPDQLRSLRRAGGP